MFKRMLITSMFSTAIIIILIFWCRNEEDGNITKVTITTGGKAIDYHMVIFEQDTVNDSDKIANTFIELIDEQSVIVLVKKDETIEIEFNNNPPKKVTIYDHYIYESDGRNQYGDADVREIQSDGNEYSFKLGTTSAELFESDLRGYKYRGLRLLCEWEDHKCEYVFVVKTQFIWKSH